MYVIVEVVWEDAHVDSTDTLGITYIQQKHRPTTMQTLGWLLIDNDTGVSVANERCLDQGDEGFRGVTFIPRSLIRSIIPVKKPRQPRKKLTCLKPSSQESSPSS